MTRRGAGPSRPSRITDRNSLAGVVRAHVAAKERRHPAGGRLPGST